jgi:hypothetical protein
MDLNGPNVHQVTWLLMMITYKNFFIPKKKGKKQYQNKQEETK